MIHRLDALNGHQLPEVGGKAARLGELASSGFDVPEGFVATSDASPEALLAAYEALSELLGDPEPAVAVRSSAVGEDGAEASFAGQLLTCLNVKGGPQLLRAVAACRESLDSEVASRYRTEMGQARGGFSVIVQALLAPDVAGVAFSANPVSGDRQEILIDASYGLGEAVVSGLATPDQIRLAKADGALLNYRVGEKAVQVVPTDSGTAVVPVAPEDQARHALAPQALKALLALVLAVEAHTGAPQDVEWALVGQRLYLLQSRPITALPPEPPPGGWPLPAPGGRYERRNVAEHFPGPVSPLAETLVLPPLASRLHGLAAEVGYGLESPALASVNGTVYARSDMTHLPSRPFRAAWASLKLLGPPSRWEARPGHRARLAPLLAERPDTLQARIRWCEAYVEALALTWADVHRLSAGWRWSEFALRRALGGDGLAAGALLAGYPSPVDALEAALQGIAAEGGEQVKAALAAPSPWQALLALDEAQATRAAMEALLPLAEALPASLDPRAPMPFAELDALCRLAGQPVDARRVGPSRERSARAIAEARPPRRWLLRVLIPWAQAHAAVREPALSALGLGWGAFRRELLAIGGELGGAPEAIFWWRWDEVRARASGEAAPSIETLAGRERLWREQASYAPPLILGGVPWEGRGIQGVPASPGRVIGTVRVVMGPEDFDSLAPGEVLVAPATTPAWTPLFRRAAAIVTDVGGPLSHGSIVAREFGIPAVLGAESATRRLRSGMRVLVDGARGLVIPQ